MKNRAVTATRNLKIASRNLNRNSKCCERELQKELINVLNKSCGKCIPCREGTKMISELINNFPIPDNLEHIERLARVIAATALCKIGVNIGESILGVVSIESKINCNYEKTNIHR